MKTQLCPRTLRWVMRTLRKEAERLRGTALFQGYVSALEDIRIEARQRRAIEKRTKKAKKPHAR